jgi:hypothetical protein
MTTMTITGTARDSGGNLVTASVNVEVSVPAAVIAGGGRAARASLAAPAIARGVTIAGFAGSSGQAEIVAAPQPSPNVPQALKSRIYSLFTGGYR